MRHIYPSVSGYSPTHGYIKYKNRPQAAKNVGMTAQA